MSIRTPSTTQSRQALLDLERTNERLVQNQTRITTGNRLTSPGDDPAAAASILSFGNSIQANTEYLKQVDAATGYLSSSEDAVSSAINDVERLMEISASGSSASVPELESIRTHLLALANTQSQGKYLFAGTNTQTQPFSDTLPVTYNGTTGLGTQGDINLNVTSTYLVTTNLRGDEVFLGGKNAAPGNANDIFQAVKDLETALSTGNTALRQTVDTNLNSIFANLNQAQSELGGRQAGLLSLKDTLSGLNVTLQGMQDAQQGTDYAKAATEYSQDQTTQTATFNLLGKANKTNLFDYLA
jgi:flagellar hook-associated protein 3 FlgL